MCVAVVFHTRFLIATSSCLLRTGATSSASRQLRASELELHLTLLPGRMSLRLCSCALIWLH
jgi:hypothetical protein